MGFPYHYASHTGDAQEALWVSHTDDWCCSFRIGLGRRREGEAQLRASSASAASCQHHSSCSSSRQMHERPSCQLSSQLSAKSFQLMARARGLTGAFDVTASSPPNESYG